MKQLPFQPTAMNEQLIVKNFGPIKDATVDFKRVTVFIGPTGGGKSTLAKLAAVFHDERIYFESKLSEILRNYSINNYMQNNSYLQFSTATITSLFDSNLKISSRKRDDARINSEGEEDIRRDLKSIGEKVLNTINSMPSQNYKDLNNIDEVILQENENTLYNLITEVRNLLKNNHGHHFTSSKQIYIPAERTFISSIEYSWAGLLKDNIGLSILILEFANSFSLSRKTVSELDIHFLNAKYLHLNGRDFIEIPNRKEPLMLLETSSGMQSVTPLLVLIEHLNRNTEQAQSFIIEEPELNLYPTAQQGLLNWLVEKCTKGENDLTITTHSPYILSHLNLLLYAYQVAEQHPERADEVAELVPRESWINPKEFACYQVENGGVISLVNEDLGLIDDNGLDGLSGDAADAFDNLIRLSKGVALK
ncbi:ATP-binding protein [Hymenobacter sp. RP-2-7]|uniref:ATP-binding protein n=1 Tax=Hymenobacter polaris TaxID=2682546 RepID=A0A7Y0AGY1_9BACT|nr:AAA family ATPase [Hymenobacter polaris]NML67120.1 ATP-binding protein [Hymenobacter polaris]